MDTFPGVWFVSNKSLGSQGEWEDSLGLRKSSVVMTVHGREGRDPHEFLSEPGNRSRPGFDQMEFCLKHVRLKR